MGEIEVVRHTQIDGLHMFFDTMEYRTSHFHREFELIWIMSGRLEIRADQLRLEAEPGDMMLFNPGQTHEFYKLGESCTFLCVQISPELLERGCPEAGSIRFGRISLCGEEEPGNCHTWARQLLGVARQYLERPEGYALYCVGQTHLLFRDLLMNVPHRRISREELEEQEKRSARLQRLLRFVDDNYMHKVLLSEFARQEGLSVSYLSHFVREMLQQSFQEYVNTVRFYSACKKIASGKRKMLDVCVESGFSDYRYFSRAFRERLGMTPEEYSRQTMRPVEEEAGVHRSMHSLERFHTRAESVEMLNTLEKSLL